MTQYEPKWFSRTLNPEFDSQWKTLQTRIFWLKKKQKSCGVPQGPVFRSTLIFTWFYYVTLFEEKNDPLIIATSILDISFCEKVELWIFEVLCLLFQRQNLRVPPVPSLFDTPAVCSIPLCCKRWRYKGGHSPQPPSAHPNNLHRVESKPSEATAKQIS